MSTTTLTENEALKEKTREFCHFILDDPSFAAAQGCIDAYEEDEVAQELYNAWQQKAAELHQKHHEGHKPTSKELVEMDLLRSQAMENPVAADFFEAENLINDIFRTVMKMLQKTLQDGAVPTDEELNTCCGGGCGCH
jgi:cell fate (sporulation/competence/biofilm development) regulator YlbF (YheA/YmcA/DUF963 family)